MDSPPRLRQVNGSVMTPGPIANTNPFETPAASRTPAEVETPTGRTRVFRNAAFATELCDGVRFSWGPVKVREVAAASIHVAAPHPSGWRCPPPRPRPPTTSSPRLAHTPQPVVDGGSVSTFVDTKNLGSPRPEAAAQGRVATNGRTTE